MKITMSKREISKAIIARLPKYYRHINDLLAAGMERVSSYDLSLLMKSNPSQVRQDFNVFGGFGQQGYGYNVRTLHQEIGHILGIEKKHNIIVIGSGNLGQALVNYAGFGRNGFVMKGMFDINPKIIGLTIRGIEVQPIDDLEQFIRENDIHIAALTIPKKRAQEVANRLSNAGIKAIWNFAHTDLIVPDDVVVENVHLSDSLMQLTFRMKFMSDTSQKEQARSAS